LDDQFCEEIDEAVHLCAAGYGATGALVRLARLTLSVMLADPRIPVVCHRHTCAFDQAIEYTTRVHRHSVPNFFPPSTSLRYSVLAGCMTWTTNGQVF
jgi:hypothetical protein